MKKLSIIVPFHNSAHKCLRLLATLQTIDNPLVELILVDDASTDGTLALLNEFKAKCSAEVLEAGAVNTGPGGARNIGLARAAGQYVWFVDSDDDIALPALNFFLEREWDGVDFIDFNVQNRNGIENSLSLEAGRYQYNDELVSNFGRICSKILRRDVVTQSLYPANCLYEDTAAALLFAIHVNSFIKTDLVGYVHHEDYFSITRGGQRLGSRYFDRILTLTMAYHKACELTNSLSMRRAVDNWYINTCLCTSVSKLVTKAPGERWFQCVMVMKLFQHNKADSVSHVDTLAAAFSTGNFASKGRFAALYVLALLPFRYKRFFRGKRADGWGEKAIVWPAVSAQDRQLY